MKSKSLIDLFIGDLRDSYDSEKQLVKALPKIMKAATAEELKEAVAAHLEQTKEHVARIEQIFAELGEAAKGKPCEATKGLIKETEEAIEEHEKGCLRDAALIVCAQKVEHYEIASYGSLSAFAQQLGKKSIVDILQKTLKEEHAANDKLTEVADSGINADAAELAEV